MVPLLPKLRGHFAEFLNHSSLDRLSILYLTTCVGLGYGPCTNSLEAFLGSIGSLNSPQSATHHLSGYMSDGFAYQTPYRLTPVQPLTGPATFLRHPIACLLPAKVPCSPIRFSEENPSGFGWLVPLIQHGRGYTGTGISTRCPSTTPVGLALGPDSPWAD